MKWTDRFALHPGGHDVRPQIGRRLHELGIEELPEQKLVCLSA